MTSLSLLLHEPRKQASTSSIDSFEEGALSLLAEAWPMLETVGLWGNIPTDFIYKLGQSCPALSTMYINLSSSRDRTYIEEEVLPLLLSDLV